MRNLESKLQIECVKWFKLQYPKVLIMSIPNGGHRNIVTASIMKAEGVLAGVPDLFIPFPANGYSGLFIEMKHGKNTPTDKQIEIMDRLESLGYKCYVCDSFEYFKSAVEGYLHCKIKPLINE